MSFAWKIEASESYSPSTWSKLGKLTHKRNAHLLEQVNRLVATLAETYAKSDNRWFLPNAHSDTWAEHCLSTERLPNGCTRVNINTHVVNKADKVYVFDPVLSLCVPIAFATAVNFNTCFALPLIVDKLNWSMLMRHSAEHTPITKNSHVWQFCPRAIQLR